METPNLRFILDVVRTCDGYKWIFIIEHNTASTREGSSESLEILECVSFLPLSFRFCGRV